MFAYQKLCVGVVTENKCNAFLSFAGNSKDYLCNFAEDLSRRTYSAEVCRL